MTRDSELLPEPLGPITPSTSPAVRRKLTLVRIAVLGFGAATVTFSTERLPVGFGRSVTPRSAGKRARVSDKRLMLSRAATNPRQLAIAVSIGASARPIMIEAAIIAPALIS